MIEFINWPHKRRNLLTVFLTQKKLHQPAAQGMKEH
jgi:hypothetical protein